MFLRPIKSAAKERRSNRQYKPVWITAQVTLLAFCVSLDKSRYVFLFKLLTQKALRLNYSDRVGICAICSGAWIDQSRSMLNHVLVPMSHDLLHQLEAPVVTIWVMRTLTTLA